MSALLEAQLAGLRDCLRGDGVAVIPTDTVYGLACNPASAIAVQRIYELKGRPAAKPAAVNLAGAVRPGDVQQLLGLYLSAYALQHMPIAAPDVDLFDAKTVNCRVHEAASLAKSTS